MSNAIPQQAKSFLQKTPPWHTLPEQEIERVLRASHSVYLTDSSQALLQQQVEQGYGLVLIQNGDFEICHYPELEQERLRFISDGDYFVTSENNLGAEVESLQKVHTAGLAFCISDQILSELSVDYPELTQFFSEYLRQEQSKTLSFRADAWQSRALSEFCTTAPERVSPTKTVMQCAKRMSEQHISSLLVCEGQILQGIVTDKDLRNRVLANALPLETPVSEVMTLNPSCVNSQNDWLDAVCVMSEGGFSHVPILNEQRKPIGIITKTDILQQQRNNIGFLIKSLSRSQSLYELMQSAWQIPHFIRFNLQGNNSFAAVGQWLSRATDVMTRRLIGFFIEKHGEPPMQFSWLVYGSQARRDQLLTSDQDNGLLLEREPSAEEADYFARLADYTCAGLAKCGIRLCSGNIMASNSALRLSVDNAVAEAQHCVTEPTKDAIMHFNIFMDVRCVAGDHHLFDELQEKRKSLFQRPLFLAALARDIDSYDVPLNLFQRFVFDKNADSRNAINLKEHAVSVINSIVRMHALAEGIKQAGTLERLSSLPDKSGLIARDRENLKHIWLFLNELRIRSQLQQNRPDNFVEIDKLAPAQKYQLKNAFKIIQRAQSAALLKFSAGIGS